MNNPSSQPISARVFNALAIGLLIVHASLLAWSAARHTPNVDEVGHLSAGISHWYFGRFELYRVNPPLVRMVAALPVILARPATDWGDFYAETRSEWKVGEDFLEANGTQSFWYFTLARWGCIPLSLLGGYICLRWAGALYGQLAGLLALTLWCFCPSILGIASMITPDAGAAALGVAAAYSFWRWLQQPNWRRALGAGLVMGLAELTKTTWLVLFLLWPLLWVMWKWLARHDSSRGHWSGQVAQLNVILVMALLSINLGYGFEGSFQRLGGFPFFSRTLRGPETEQPGLGPGNRFAKSWLGAVPVPLPRDYLLGIDLQKVDFEQGKQVYFRGEWRRDGLWYYYLYALAIKVPLGTWSLVLLAILFRVGTKGFSGSWRDELVVLTPLIVVLALVSSQTGLNRHLRYVLPIFPFAFIWVSQVARVFVGHSWKKPALVAAAGVWSITSSLLVYPHSLSYFNELVGGPTGGHSHLLGSNIDWGQDLFFLKRWLDKHDEARPIGLAYYGFVDPALAGIESSPLPTEPVPGWYALSVTELRSREGKYAYFLRLRPVAMAGYSIYVYHITPEEAKRVRQELGLGE